MRDEGWELRKCYIGQQRETQRLQFPPPAVSHRLCGLHQGQHPHPRVPEPCASGRHLRNDHALTNHGHGPLLPPRGQHGRPQDPSRPRRSTSPSLYTFPSLKTFSPRTLPGQLPGLKPQGRKLKGAPEPWSFFLVQKPLRPSLPSTAMQAQNKTQT